MYIYAMFMLKLCIYMIMPFILFYFIFFIYFFDEFACCFNIVLASKPYVVHLYIYVPECWYIVFVCHLASMFIKIYI